MRPLGDRNPLNSQSFHQNHGFYEFYEFIETKFPAELGYVLVGQNGTPPKTDFWGVYRSVQPGHTLTPKETNDCAKAVGIHFFGGVYDSVHRTIP